MEKVRQRNWLIIITVILFISTVIVLFFTNRQSLGIGICEYNGVEYTQGEFLPNYEGRSDCFCAWSGDVLCDNTELSMSYDSFNTTNLGFSYGFKNFLEKDKPDLTAITLIDINHVGSKLDISVEREALCTQDGIAPVQIGLYELKSDTLVLTNVTNRDESIYSRVCSISNMFSLEGFDLGTKSNFSILYQNESGQLYDLSVCIFNKRVYGKGDVFKDTKKEELCTCIGPELDCEKL